MKTNRNDLCHCGSGKKYKKCHLEADDARERGKRSLTTLPQWLTHHGGGLVASVRERARSEEAVQTALKALHEGANFPDSLADPIAEQVALFDVVVGEQPLITQATTEDLADQHQQSLRTGFARSCLSLHEVLECKRGKGVRLRDRLLERSRWINDPTLALKLEPMEVVMGRVLGFDKRNVLLDGWEKVGFRGRKAAITDLVAALAVEVVPPEPVATSPVAAAMPAQVPESDEELEEPLDEGAEGEEAEEAVDETKPTAEEAPVEIQAARARWLKAHVVEVVRRARSAAAIQRT